MTAQPIPFAGLEDKQAARNRTPLPGGGQIAALIREGATVENLCTQYGASKTSVYTRLRDAGYTPAGIARDTTPRLAPRIAEADFLQTDEEWMAARACAEGDPEWWHSTYRAETQKAISICRECPVQTACLAYALRIEGATSNNYRWGIWGGLDPDQRKVLVSGHRKATS